MSDFLSEFPEKIAQFGMIPNVDFSEQELKTEAESLLKNDLPIMLISNVKAGDLKSLYQLHEAYPELMLGIKGKFGDAQLQQLYLYGISFIIFDDFDEQACIRVCEQGILPIPSIENGVQANQACFMGLKMAHIEVGKELEIQETINSWGKFMQIVMSGRKLNESLSSHLARHEIAACVFSLDELRQDHEDLSVCVQKKLMSFFKLHLAHVGINTDSHEESLNNANMLASLLHLGVREGKKSAFAGSMFEIMYSPFYYEHGHVALGCADATRAYLYFKRRHIEFIEDTVSRDPDGNIIAAYFKQNFAGFGIHLLWEK